MAERFAACASGFAMMNKDKKRLKRSLLRSTVLYVVEVVIVVLVHRGGIMMMYASALTGISVCRGQKPRMKSTVVVVYGME